jgi:putative hydrolase of the HAD superfamily
MGGVIIKWDDRWIIRGFAKKYNVSQASVEKYFYLLVLKTYTGKLSELNFLRKIASCTGIKAGPKEMQGLWKTAFRKKSNLDKNVFNLIKTLHKNGYKIAVLSNTSGKYRAQTYAKRMRKYMRLAVMSCDVKMKKPEKRIFIYTMKKLRASPGECVFIDDKKENVAGARKVGMHTIQFRNAAQLRRDLKKLDVKIS